VQVLDPVFFTTRLKRLREFSRALVELTLGDDRGKPPQGKGQSPKTSERERERLLNQAERAMWQGVDPDSIRSISEVLMSLTSGEIALRVIPCGPDRPELSFGGVLLDRVEYLQKEREALFSRYGSILGGWTVVVQIEAVPYPLDEEPQISAQDVVFAEKTVNRAGVERMCLDLLRMVDATGLTEGPRWPSITVTPLALYRDIPSGPS
jgi:hypothetical protein